MARSGLLGLACGLLLLVGCAPAATPTATAAYRTLAVADAPLTALWIRPSVMQQLANIQRAKVGWMTAPHESAPMHMHVKLEVFYNGRPTKVPNGIGMLGPTRMAELHTHDDWGFIHVEGATYHPYTLGQFFDVWGVSLQGARVTKSGKPVADPYKAILAEHQSYRVYLNRR